MQPAPLGRALLPPPAAGAYVFARGNGPGARSAADAGKAAVVQLVVGDSVRPDIGPDFLVAPVGEGVELDQAVVRVVGLDRDLLAGGRLPPAQPGDPGLLSRQRPAQRLDLADVAARLAQLDAAVETVDAVIAHVVLHGVGARKHDAEPRAVARGYRIEQRVGLVVQPSRVKREHVDAQRVPENQVGEHHVLGAQAARQRGRCVLDRDPAQQRLGGAYFLVQYVCHGQSLSLAVTTDGVGRAGDPAGAGNRYADLQIQAGTGIAAAATASAKTRPSMMTVGPVRPCCDILGRSSSVQAMRRVSGNEAFSTTSTGRSRGAPAAINAAVTASACPAPM